MLLEKLADVGRLPVFSSGLRGEAFQQFAILFDVEILGHTVHALEREDIAAHFFRCAGAGFGTLGRDLGEICADFGSGPGGLEFGRDYRVLASSRPEH